MSLDSCRPLSPLSLSLTSLLSRPVFIQGSGRVARPLLALAGGGGFSYWRRPLQREGCFSLLFTDEARHRGRQAHNDAGWRRHGARSFFWLASTVSWPNPFGSFRRTDSRAWAGPSWACPMSAVFLRGQVMPLIPVACRGRLPVL